MLSDRVMVRVGGGWETLEHFLLKHDPCRLDNLTSMYHSSISNGGEYFSPCLQHWTLTLPKNHQKHHQRIFVNEGERCDHHLTVELALCIYSHYLFSHAHTTI